MKLAIDAVGVKHSGGATVLLETLQAVASCDPIEKVVIMTSPADRRAFAIACNEKIRVLDIQGAESAIGRICWIYHGLERQLRRLHYDVFFAFTGVGRAPREYVSIASIQQSLPYSSEALHRCPLATQLRMKAIRWATGRSSKAADHIVVQTEVMRETIANAFGVPRDRISVFMPSAPLLPPPRTDSPKLCQLELEREGNVLLYVGNDSPHKNLSVIAEGLLQIPEASRPKWYATLPPASSFCRRGVLTALGTLDAGELHAAYRKAAILIMPSLVETVGLPMLEAMRVGTPVLAADRPYAHAVCEDAALFFDPVSPQDFTRKASHLLENDALRAKLIERGYALVQRRDGRDVPRRLVEKLVEVASNKQNR